MLAVARDHPITTGIGTRRADELAARLPRRMTATQPPPEAGSGLIP